MSANRRRTAGAPRDRMLTGKMAGLVAGIALVAVSLAWWLSPAREGLRPPRSPGTDGLWIRAGAADVWEIDTGRKSELVMVQGTRTPTAVGDRTELEDPRERPGWVTMNLSWIWSDSVVVFIGHPVTVVESRTVDGTTWLRAVNSIEHLPADTWCPPDLAGDWDLTPPGPGTPAQVRLHPDGKLGWGADENREWGTWRASGPDLFLEVYPPRGQIGLWGIGHFRISPDRTQIEPGTTLRWTGVRRK